MTDVFISYKREERARCVAIYNALVALDLSVWFDAHIEPGTDFDREIEREVRRAKAVLVLWSALAAESDWIRAEARTGRQADRLVAVRLDDCLPPLEFASVQAVDLFGPSDFRAGEGWRQIVGRIGRLVGRTGLGDYVRCEQAADAGAWRGWIAANRCDPLVGAAQERLAALADRDGPAAPAAALEPQPSAPASKAGMRHYGPLVAGGLLAAGAAGVLAFGTGAEKPVDPRATSAAVPPGGSDLPVLPPPERVVPMAPPGGGKPLFCRPEKPYALAFVPRRTDMPPAGNLTISNVWLAWHECRGPIRVEGHVEAGGAPSGAKADSQRMADVVAGELRARGIDPRAITAVGIGSDRPLPGKAADAGDNRRVEIYLLPAG